MDETRRAMWEARGVHYRILSAAQSKKNCCIAFLGFQVTVYSKKTPIFPYTDSYGTIV